MTDQDDDRAEWVGVGTYTNGLEADLIRSLLEAAGIPVFTKGKQPGIFGGDYGGNISGGITLHVPSPEVGRAKAVLAEGGGDGDSGGDDDSNYANG